MVWTRGPTVSVAQKDGSNPRKLTDVPGLGEYPVVSPDAGRIRLTVIDDQLHRSIWEMRSDGTGLHQLLKGWRGSLAEQGDAWTADGEYFLFHSQGTGRSDLWALPERKTLLGKAPLPIRLTNGPISFGMIRPSPDGKKIFAIGSTLRGELVRYDAKAGNFIPYLSGMSAIGTTASRDGKWIASVSYPDHALWRANPDGSGRVQLTFPPMMVFYPQISPDASKIAFSGLTEAGLGLYVLELRAKKMEKLVDLGHTPTWSPDGNSLAFTAFVAGKHLWDEAPFCEIHTVDLRTRKITVIADPSGSRYAPWWPSPNQIVAFGAEDYNLYVYDFKTNKWSLLAPESIDAWTPSLDGGSLLILVDEPGRMAVLRMRTPDFHVETIVKLTDLRLTQEEILEGAENGKWIGIAADGSPVLTRDVGSNEIYALDVKWP
jgi:Tol biopolymer transport system component